MVKRTIPILVVIVIIGALAGYLFYTSYVQGTLILSITDPPPNPYPSSILHIYITFTSVDVHLAGQASQSGWHTITTSQTIDMITVINTAKTLGSTNLPSGKYDNLRFNTTTAVVTFATGTLGLSAGGNVTYTIPGNGLQVPIIEGGFQITATSTVNLQLTLSFNDSEILSMNGHLTPVAKAQLATSASSSTSGSNGY